MTLVKLLLGWSDNRPIDKARRMLELIAFLFKGFSKWITSLGKHAKYTCRWIPSLTAAGSIEVLDFNPSRLVSC